MILFIDVETTGFDFLRNDVIEIGAILCDNDLEMVSEYNEFGRPNPKHWGEEAEGVHKISLDRALKFQPQSQLVDSFATFLKPYWGKNLTVEHSLNFFDYKMIEHTFMKQDRLFDWRRFSMIGDSISTLKLARKHLDLQSNRLGNVCHHFGITLKNAHQAIEDVRATLEVYRRLNEIAQTHERHWGNGDSRAHTRTTTHGLHKKNKHRSLFENNEPNEPKRH